MFVIKFKTLFISISVFFVTAAIVSLIIFGLPLGIDFKGGSALEVQYSGPRPTVSAVTTAVTNAGFTNALVQPVGSNGLMIETQTLSDAQRAAVLAAASLEQPATQTSFTSIGPSVGTELKHKAIASIILVLIAIILFVAYAFRKVSQPVSSWKYGFAVIIALVHDLIIPTGVFALLGHFYGAQVDTLFIVALLTTLGLSVADTIVVFDRIREHLNGSKSTSFPKLVGESLSETFVRSINTSLVVLVMVLSLAFFGPATTKLFAITLAVGMFFGTYSSIFLASPLLVVMEQGRKKKK
ncbi:MAG: protein-export rane protein SecF, preprotein translocase subunit SecF [Candidatus Nomurabacteria bacterium]|jgi:preprotein translocase subunit SecF|nr:protein-export rane protein SecF, preprotein translocase subunit SecF [Candidatus Nomurabacteria bacterium]